MIKANNLKYRYTIWQNEIESKRTALDDVSMDIRQGEFVAILGPNGSGKSTFAKHLSVLLKSESGSLWIDGKDAYDVDMLKTIRDTVGMVFQNPDNQIIGTSVEEDVAFGPEQRNIPSITIQERVIKSLDTVGLLSKKAASPFRLSGGQKQRLAIAGTLAADNTCIVLDEPTAMLDPASRKEVVSLLEELHRQGKTIILITHHTDEVLGADRIILMSQGKVIGEGTPGEIFSDIDLLRSIGMDAPASAEAAFRLLERGIKLRLPVLTSYDLACQLVSLAEEKGLLKGNSINSDHYKNNYIKRSEAKGDPILKADNLEFSYGIGTIYETKVLKGVSLDIYQGEFLALAGTSGSGKTTLIKHLNGLLHAQKGNIFYKGRSIYEKNYPLSMLRKEVGLVFQNPEQQLFSRTVIKDVCYGPLKIGMNEEEALRSAKENLELVGIDPEYYECSPYEMSGGQMRRAAIAGVLAMDPNILILDEPAAGLDPSGKRDMLELLEKIKNERGKTIILISHNIDDIAEYADRLVVLNDGKVTIQGTPEEVFNDPGFKDLGLGQPGIMQVWDELSRQGIRIPDAPVTVEGTIDLICDILGGEPYDA